MSLVAKTTDRCTAKPHRPCGWWRWCAVLLLFAPLWTSCRDNDLGIDKRIANQAPETQISAGPRDGAGNPYRATFSWWGSDPDGRVEAYEFVLLDHPRGTEVSDDNPLPIDIPGSDDPRWQRTFATDTTLITLADTLLRDPEPGRDETPEDVRQQAWERWHTFFVRAIDNQGKPDPTPDYLSFNATNFAPTIELQPPARINSILHGASAIHLSWKGHDVDGTSRRPVASRWVLIESKYHRFWGTFQSWPDSLYELPARYEWSPWADWDAADGSGTSTVIRGLLPVGARPDPPSGYYIFAVQAKDEAGAVTVVFDKDTPGKNNATLIQVTGPPGPWLRVDAGPLGLHRVLGTDNRVRLEVAFGQPIRMRWEADASIYGGTIQGYRYGWNLINPEDDEGWDQNWALRANSNPVHIASDRVDYLYVQARDTAGLVTSVVFQIQGHRVTRERDVLWVDDTHDQAIAEEVNEDAAWHDVLAGLATKHGFQFDPLQDVWDVAEHRGPPPARVVFGYKAVIWSVRSGWGLAKLAKFTDPYTPRPPNAELFNYLKAYLSNGGSVWINGDQPADDLWPEERHNDNNGYFVNVTHWNDPDFPHPLVDSVGTTSLLYDFGIEMFDRGAGTGSDRFRKDHLCLGVDRAAPDGVTAQEFATTLDEGHQHDFSVPSVVLDVPGEAGVTLRTGEAAGHTHEVQLSGAVLEQLRSGRSVVLLTAEADMPQPHRHEVEVGDQIGHWGAPFLFLGNRWSPAVGIGRPNVEIYNMPGTVTTTVPPIHLPRDRVLTVYEYRSGIPVDADRGIYYPQTADRQPVFVLAKEAGDSQRYSRAICSFPPSGLSPLSHRALAEFVLVRHFGLGAP